jgi:hypothetical protein
MNNIKYLSVIIVMFLVAGCAEDFLDQKNLYQKSDESYYQTPEDIDEALTGAYAALALDAGNNNPILVAELMSDDRFPGGGNNDDGFHSTGLFTLLNEDYYSSLFASGWPGILRTNLILKRFDQAEYADETRKNQALGEAHFLRAFFYFRLSQFFGPVPLKTEPTPENLPRATPEEMYGQIALDLKKAIEIMPSTSIQNIPANRLGHATKWAAQGMMARVFLFYTGYYGKTEIDLPDGSKVTKNDVIAWLDDCIANSGHDLIPDFRNLWPYSKVQNYPLVANNGLNWMDEKGDNIETVFSIKYSLNGGWNAPQKLSYSNQNVLYSGLRQQSHVPFGQGWGAGPVNPQLWDSFEDGDIRKVGSILNVNEPNPDEGAIVDNYVWGADNQVYETGYWGKKYLPVYDSVPDANRIASIFYIEYGTPDDMQLWNMQDDILLRFADILLMAAELGGPKAQEYFDRVRTRAGLVSKPVSLENIKLERRHELAFEGLRYFDLLRWGIAKEAIEKANGTKVFNQGTEDVYEVFYPEETGGFLPIPGTEIRLSEGVLEQTPGW